MNGGIRDRFDRRRVLQLLGGVGVLQVTGVGTAASDSAGDDEDSEPTTAGTAIDWQAVERALGTQLTEKEGGVHSASWPRTDLSVTADGVSIDPAFAFGSHAEFLAVGEREVLVRGDLVLTGAESDRVLSRLQEGGVKQTAIHQHLPDLSQAIWWNHIAARGDPIEIARTINAALSMSDTPMESTDNADTNELPLDTDRLDKIMGATGTVKSGVYKYGIPYGKQVTIDGVAVPPTMGTTMPLAFQPLGGNKAAINGDFIMVASEVNPVIRALQNHDIRAVSLHNHFLTDAPRLFYMHFWATGEATTLATGLRAALDRTDTATEC